MVMAASAIQHALMFFQPLSLNYGHTISDPSYQNILPPLQYTFQGPIIATHHHIAAEVARRGWEAAVRRQYPASTARLAAAASGWRD